MFPTWCNSAEKYFSQYLANTIIWVKCIKMCILYPMGWISQLEHFVEKLAYEKKGGKSLKTHILFPSTSIFWLSWSRMCAHLPLFQLTRSCPSCRTLVCIHNNSELLYPAGKLEWRWTPAVRSCLWYWVLPIPVIWWGTDKTNTVACCRNLCML